MGGKIAAVFIAIFIMAGLGQCSTNGNSDSMSTGGAIPGSQASSSIPSSSGSSKVSSSMNTSSTSKLFSSSGDSSSSYDKGEIHSDYISWTDAHNHLGEYVSARGEVKSVRTIDTKNGKATFINIGLDYPNSNRLTAVIWPSARKSFVESIYYKQFIDSSFAGRKVCVSGVVKNYEGVAQIEVSGIWAVHEYF